MSYEKFFKGKSLTDLIRMYSTEFPIYESWTGDWINFARNLIYNEILTDNQKYDLSTWRWKTNSTSVQDDQLAHLKDLAYKHYPALNHSDRVHIVAWMLSVVLKEMPDKKQ